jgi:hypothetical protein
MLNVLGRQMSASVDGGCNGFTGWCRCVLGDLCTRWGDLPAGLVAVVRVESYSNILDSVVASMRSPKAEFSFHRDKS